MQQKGLKTFKQLDSVALLRMTLPCNIEEFSSKNYK